jgi:ABC-type molybdate transport system permease subunit
MAAVKGLVRLVGPSEFALRLVPCFAGILAVAVTYRLARRALPRSGALLAASLLAAADPFLTAAHQVKNYALDALFTAPMVLPPTVLGFYILCATGPRSMPGHWYSALFGSRLPFTFQGIVLASVLYNLPFAVRPFTAALAAVDRRLIEASWCLGVSQTEARSALYSISQGLQAVFRQATG